MADAATLKNGTRAADGEEKEGGRETVHHTVTACVRCRQVSLFEPTNMPEKVLTECSARFVI
jgi:hypothetical protein